MSDLYGTLSVPQAVSALSALDAAGLIAADSGLRVALIVVVEGETVRYFLPGDPTLAGSIEAFGTGDTVLTVVLD